MEVLIFLGAELLARVGLGYVTQHYELGLMTPLSIFTTTSRTVNTIAYWFWKWLFSLGWRNPEGWELDIQQYEAFPVVPFF